MGKPKLKPLPESSTKPGSERATYYVEQLAIAFDQMIAADRIVIYAQALADLSEAQLKYAFEQALKNFKPGFDHRFPYPSEIREWAYSLKREEETAALIKRSDKPPDWDPVTAMAEWKF